MTADDSKAEEPSSGNLPGASDEIQRKVEELVEAYLRRKQDALPADVQQLVGQHPDLAPYLEARLRGCLADNSASTGSIKTEAENFSTATVDFSQATGTQLYRDYSMRVKCPHCGNPLQVVSKEIQEVICGSCGSSVRVGSEGSVKSSLNVRQPLPQQLAHFRIVRLLGEGGFGVVYLAEDLHLANRQVALKVPRRGFFATQEEEQRFFREAGNVARLRHPNIAQVYQVSEDRNTPFIASEFIDGLTLRDLARGTKLSYREIAHLVIQIAEAVAFAHTDKIIHRDLKTSNILVDRNLKAYVVDFGLSRRDDAEITMTIEGAIVGTIQYMAPEQASGKQSEIGPWSDIYSLGIILYELLSGELPFRGSKQMMVQQVLYEDPPGPRQLNPNIPRDLETITLKAIAKRPSQRYASAQALADDLRRWVLGEPIKARRVSTAGRYWKWCTRHPSTAALLATVTALLVLSTGLALLWATEQTRLKLAEKTARLESDGRQYELSMQNGGNALLANDLTTANLWFSEALKIKDDLVNRTRIGMVQDQLPKLTQVWSTGAPVDALRFSEDGTRLAIGGFDGPVEVIDMHRKASSFKKAVHSFADFDFSPSGNHLLTFGHENHAQLWNVQNGTLVKTLAHTDFVVSAQFHRDADVLATGSFDSFVRVWDVVSGELKIEREFDGLHVKRVAFVPESTSIAVVTNKPDEWKDSIHIWDYVGDRLVGSVALENHLLSLGFGDHGTRLYSATQKGEVQVWNTASGEAVGDTIRLPFSPNRIMFADSERFISIAYDSDVESWNLLSGKPEGIQIRPAANCTSVGQDVAGRLLALGASDGRVSVHWQSDGSAACSTLINSEGASAVTFHPDGRRLAVGGRDGIVQLWDLAGAAPECHVFQHAGPVRSALFSPDGKRCFSVGLDGKAYMWNADTGQAIGKALEHADGISECDVSVDGKLFATASADKTVKVWNGFDGTQVGESFIHDFAVATVVFSPDGKQLATGCIDGAVSCWDTLGSSDAGAARSPRFEGKHANRIMSIAYSPNGDLLATASLDGDIRGWHTSDGSQAFGPFVHPGSVFDCAYLADGIHLLTCGSNGWVYVWNCIDNELVQHLQCAGTVRSVDLSADGRRILTNETDGRTRLWRWNGSKLEPEGDVRHPSIDSVYDSSTSKRFPVFAFAGGSLALGSDKPQSGAVVLWDMSERRQLGPALRHSGPVGRVQFDVTGTKLLTASEDHTARLWLLPNWDLPQSDVIRTARLYSQSVYDSGGRVRAMTPSEQLTEFATLSSKYPSLFYCNARDIDRWEEDARLLHAKDEPNPPSGAAAP